MRLTVLIPTVNRPAMVCELVKRISDFRLDFIDVCVSINGGDPCTTVALTPFKNSGKIDLLIWDELLPISEHWAKAITTIKNELVIVLPDDDKLTSPSWLIEIKNYFEKYERAVIGFGNYVEVDFNSGIRREIMVSLPHMGEGKDLLRFYKTTFQGYRGFGLPNLCTAFKKSAYDDCGGIDLECMSPDTYIFCKILSVGDYVFSEIIAAEYNVHEGNLSKSLNLGLLASDVRMAFSLSKYLAKKKQLPGLAWVLRFHWVFVRRLIGAMRRNYLNF